MLGIGIGWVVGWVGGWETYRVKRGMLRVKCRAMSAEGKGPKRLRTCWEGWVGGWVGG